MDSRLLQQIIRSLQAKVRCPVCGAKYPEASIEFRGQHRNFYPKEAPLPPIKADEVIEFAWFLDKTKSKLSSWLR